MSKFNIHFLTSLLKLYICFNDVFLFKHIWYEILIQGFLNFGVLGCYGRNLHSGDLFL